MRHDGKVPLQLFVAPETRDLVRREAKARKITQSEFVRLAVERTLDVDQRFAYPAYTPKHALDRGGGQCPSCKLNLYPGESCPNCMRSI